MLLPSHICFGISETGSADAFGLFFFHVDTMHVQNPAADIAAQLSAALALSAKVAKEHGTAADAEEAVEWEVKAVAALAYANRMVDQFTLEGSTCTESPAAGNCMGSTCTEVDPDDGSDTEGVRSCCMRYSHEHFHWRVYLLDTKQNLYANFCAVKWRRWLP